MSYWRAASAACNAMSKRRVWLAMLWATFLGRPLSFQFGCIIDRTIYTKSRQLTSVIGSEQFGCLFNRIWRRCGLSQALKHPHNSPQDSTTCLNWPLHGTLFHCTIGRMAPARYTQRWKYGRYSWTVTAATELSCSKVLPAARIGRIMPK